MPQPLPEEASSDAQPAPLGRGEMIGAGPLRVFERDLAYFRRVWRVVILGAVLQPAMYLLGIGVGVGDLVDRNESTVGTLGSDSYFAFYAAAIVATTAMFVASQEALWPTLDGFVWSNGYHAMVATPLTARDVAGGVALHLLMRSAISSVGVAALLLLFPETRSVGLIFAVPAGVLTGLAIALPLVAWTARCETDSSFTAIARFGIAPMFLFSGAFYPIELLPAAIAVVAWVTPLAHGIELSRGAILGGIDRRDMAAHVLVLVAYGAAGMLAAVRAFDRRLHS